MILPNQQCPFQSHEKLNQYGKIFSSAKQNISNQIAHRILGLSVQGLVSYIIKTITSSSEMVQPRKDHASTETINYNLVAPFPDHAIPTSSQSTSSLPPPVKASPVFEMVYYAEAPTHRV